MDENMKEQPYIFAFWFMVNDFQHQYLRFVGSIREGDFQLYIKTLSEITYWFYALDQPHYQGWLPAHNEDLIELRTMHPDIQDEFMVGKFAVQRNGKKISLMSKGKSHELSVTRI